MPIDFSRLRRKPMTSPMQFPVGEQIDYAAQPQIAIEPGISYPESVPGPFDANFRSQAPPDDSQFIADRMRQLYQPHNEAENRLNSMMDNFPQRREPSNLRKIGASMMGMRNVGKKNQSAADAAFTTQLQDRFMDKPYYQGVDEFKTKSEPAIKAAEIERQGNVNERGFANQIVSQELANRKLSETERNNKAKQDIAQQRIEIYALRSSRPNWKFDFKGPTITMTNPATGEIKTTQIPTGSLSEIDKINLQGEWGVAKQEAGTDKALAIEGARQPNRERNIELGGEEARKTKATPSGNTDPLNLQRERYNTARQLADTVPGAAKWFRFGTGGTVTLLPATAFTSAKDRAIRDSLSKQLYKMPEKSAPKQQEQFRVDLPQQDGKTITGHDYSPSRNQTRITYSDGSTQIVEGKQ